MYPTLRWFVCLLAATMLLASGAASAHPHVWVDVTSELLSAADGTVTGASEDTFKEGGANAAVGLLFLVPISVECP
jgi:ABC-type uncharacterized transport system substrate-binding protein